MTEGNVTEIVEKIESLPDGVSVGGLQNVPDSDVCCFELDVTTDDLKSLAVQVKAQDDEIRELREALEFGNEQLLPVLLRALLIECECGDDEQCSRCQIGVFAGNAQDKIQAVLDKYKHQ